MTMHEIVYYEYFPESHCELTLLNNSVVGMRLFREHGRRL